MQVHMAHVGSVEPHAVDAAHQRGRHLGQPWHAVDRILHDDAGGVQLGACTGFFLQDHHAQPGKSGGARARQPRKAGADHEQVDLDAAQAIAHGGHRRGLRCIQ
jgi:hypothetical protein